MQSETLSASFSHKNNLNQSLRDSKMLFLDKVKDQMKSYIADLESSLAINKSIIEELVKKHIWSLQEKRVMEKLSQENSRLQEQVKNLVRERDELQTKLLITEQINENYKKREAESIRDMVRVKQQFISQINRKNYTYKVLERQHEQVLDVLRVMAQNDQRIMQLLTFLKVDCKVNNKSNDSSGTEMTRERSFSKERELMMNINIFDKMKRDRNQSMKMKTSPMIKINAKDGLEIEANNLREKVLDLYKRNIKLSEALKVEKGMKVEDSVNSIFAQDSLKKWNSTNKKSNELEETETENNKEMNESNLDFSLLSSNKPFSKKSI